MCNSIFIDSKTLPKAKDGEKYEATIKGIYRTDEDGVRKFDVLSVDGRPVMDPDEEKSTCGCEGELDEHGSPLDMEDAMKIFFIKTKKG